MQVILTIVTFEITITNSMNYYTTLGDDAEQVVWCTIDRTLQLYACHKDIIYDAVQRLHAYW